MKTSIVLLLLATATCIGCKGKEGPQGMQGPAGLSFFQDKIVRGGAVTSDSIFVSIPNINVASSVIQVTVGDSAGKWIEIPFWNPTAQNSIGYLVDNTGITILNAQTAGLSNWSILIVVG